MACPDQCLADANIAYIYLLLADAICKARAPVKNKEETERG